MADENTKQDTTTVEKTEEIQQEANAEVPVENEAVDSTDTSKVAEDKTAESAAPAEVPIKKEESSVDVTKTEKAIIRQVEYYFSDANLHRDIFLREQIQKNKDGWVPFSVLSKFKRLAALSTDIEAITRALEKSEALVLEISEDKQSVRRHTECPLPEFNYEVRKEITARTVYAKGFPKTCTIDDLITYFSDIDGYVNVVQRKYLDVPTRSYKFKGSVFVTFKTVEQATAFLTAETQTYKDQPLLRMWQLEYIEKKREEGKKKFEKRPRKEEPEIVLAKNAIVKFNGAKEDTTRERIREELVKFCDGIEVAFLEYRKGEDSGYARFMQEGDADKLLQKLAEAKLKLGDDEELTFNKLEGEDEEAYLKKCIESMSERRRQSGQKKARFGKGGHRRGGHFNKGRRNGKKQDN